MKKIERPDSTTYVLDFPFHEIKDEKEVKNIMQGRSEKDIFKVMGIVDEKTFQPKLAFAIKEENKPFSYWEKYIVPLELMHESHNSGQ